jgi:UPF0755 protein
LNNKKIKTVSAIVVATLLLIGIFVYVKVFSSNTKFAENELYVNIPSNSSYDQVKQILKPFIKDMGDFEFIATKRSYATNVKSGRFLLKKGMSSFAIVSSLRKNIAVKLAFNNQERLEDLAGRVSHQIEADSTSLLQSFRDPSFLSKNGFDEETVFVICIPNTYEMYWDTNAQEFRDKMLKSYKIFWNADKIEQAKKNNLTPIQATILASIVHKESVKSKDRPKIAAVYLNRMKIAMPLQADPTIIYGIKKRDNNFNQIIKRVFERDLKIDSPYNSYTKLGLPPGPIAMPDIEAIKAVLNPDKNNYLYFCASVENFGYSEFATTYEEHLVIAKKYSDWIKSKGVTR